MDYYLSELPKETKNIIVSFLDDRSRRIMRLASTEWFNIINYDDFTIYFARTSTLPDIIQTFSRYSKPIGFRFEKTINCESNFTTLAALTNTTSLEIEKRRYKFSVVGRLPDPFTALTNLKHFSFGRINLAPHLQLFTNLTRLYVPSDFANLVHLDQLLLLTRLENVSFTAPYSETDEINIISKLRNASASLKKLKIMDNHGTVVFDEESVAKMSKLSKVFIECKDALFPFTKLPNLESMHISSDRFDDFSACSTKLTYLSIQARGSKKEPLKISALNQDYHELAVLTNLRVLSMYTALKEDQFSFLVNLTNLETLTVTEKIGGLTGQLLEWIKSTKLKTLSINNINNINYIAHLTSLEDIYAVRIADVDANCMIKLDNVTRLKTQDIQSASVFPNIRQLDMMLNLYAPHIEFGRMSQIVSLTQLESLTMPVIDPKLIPLLALHTQMTYLVVHFNYQENYDFKLFSRLTNLKILSLHSDRDYKTNDCEVLWQAIANLTNLEDLRMFDINDDSVAALEQLHKLTRLSVTGVRVSNFSETKLSNLTSLQVLSLSSGYLISKASGHTCLMNLNLPFLYRCYS